MQGKGTFDIQHATLNIQRPGLIGGTHQRRRYGGRAGTPNWKVRRTRRQECPRYEMRAVWRRLSSLRVHGTFLSRVSGAGWSAKSPLGNWRLKVALTRTQECLRYVAQIRR
jgi:hypothetical protein